MKFAVIVAVGLFAMSNPAAAISGAAYLELNKTYQNGYVLGLFHGFLQMSLVGDDADYRQKASKCLSGLKTDNELSSAFTAWLKARPEQIARETHLSFPRWIYETCPESRN